MKINNQQPVVGQSEASQRAGAAGRLLARPRTQDGMLGAEDKPTRTGVQPLRLESKRDGSLYVPAAYQAGRRMPLVLMLHGAGGDARQGLRILQQFADEYGFLLLAPDSRGRTWDIILGRYGPDVAFIDHALEETFSRYNVDPTRVAVAGFSDGASYALSIGITNGDLFSHVLAFSPGFMAPTAQEGAPRLFISHGTSDRVLPIEACSRKIVPRVQQADYEVRYREFKGGHNVPEEITHDAIGWFTGRSG